MSGAIVMFARRGPSPRLTGFLDDSTRRAFAAATRGMVLVGGLLAAAWDRWPAGTPIAHVVAHGESIWAVLDTGIAAGAAIPHQPQRIPATTGQAASPRDLPGDPIRGFVPGGAP